MGRYRRYVILSAVIVVLLAAYAAAGFLGVPYFARKSLQDFARTHYGRVLQLGEIRFNPFTLNLELTKVALPDADGQTLLAFERLQVDLQWASLWRLGPSFGTIILEQPYVRAVLRQGGELNLADLGQGFPPPAPPAQPAQKSKPPRLYIARLAVIAGTSVFEDHTRATPFRAEIKPIGFELRDFSTTAATGDAYALYAESPDGERFTWNGTLHLAPFTSRGAFEVASLKAHTLWNYLRDSVPFEVDAGVIGIKGGYQVASGGNGPLAVTVDVASAVLDHLGVKPKGAAQHYLEVSHIELDGTHVDLAQHSVNVAKVLLAGGDIQAWLEQGRLNLMELVPGARAAGEAGAAAPAADPPAASAAAAPSAGAKAAWSVAVPDITVQDFKVSAEDRALKPAAVLHLDPINVHLAGFNLTPEDTLDFTLSTGVNGSGKVSARGKLTPRTTAVSAHIEAERLGLTALQPYIAQYTSMTLLKGTLGARADIERRADGALTVEGSTALHDLRTVDNALHQDFVKWKELRVADIRYASAPASLRVGSVTALEPYVRMIVAPNRTLNITEILTPPGAAPRAQAAAPAEQPKPAPRAKGAAGSRTAPPAPAKPLTPFPMSIGTVRLVNGSANYADLWIKPSFAIGIESLGGTVTGLSSDPRSRAKVKLDGKIDRYSPWHVDGEVNLLSAALFTDLTMGFKDVDLTVVNPYSGHFAGYKIDKGKLSVDVTYKIDQRKLDAQQHFVVDQLELGERVESPDAVHLPLKIAVALLKDRNGVIDLNLPMNGSLDDPKFRIGPIIWKIFVNLITKAATAPFALLGHLFGGGEHMNVIAFPAGSAELDKGTREQLGALIKALKERPQLKLDVPIVYSTQVDAPQLASAHLQQELLARVANTRAGKKHPDTAGEMALADPEQHFKLLLEQYQADLGKDAQLPPSVVAVQQAPRKETPPYDAAINDLSAALISHVPVPDADLEALGKQRAQAIQDALLAGGAVDAARVFIVNAPPRPQSGDKVQVELAVK